MKVEVKDIKGKLISINPEPWDRGYEVVMEHEYYKTIIHNVEEKDIIVIMDK